MLKSLNYYRTAKLLFCNNTMNLRNFINVSIFHKINIIGKMSSGTITKSISSSSAGDENDVENCANQTILQECYDAVTDTIDKDDEKRRNENVNGKITNESMNATGKVSIFFLNHIADKCHVLFSFGNR